LKSSAPLEASRAMPSCRGCGRPRPGVALTCSLCGQLHPSGALARIAGAVLVLFSVGVLVGLAQVVSLSGSEAEPDPAPLAEAVERWGVGLHGVEQTVVIPRTLLGEHGMRRLLREFQTLHPDRHFVRIHLFIDPEAARLWSDGIDGELDDMQDWFHRSWVGTYQRNRRLGTETLTYAQRGLNMTEHPRTLEGGLD